MSSCAKREALFVALAELYSSLDDQLAGGDQDNPCGECRECCTGSGLNKHNVTALEIDYIRRNEGAEAIQEFRRFLKRDGEVDVCPYFDEEIWGCGIYTSRPFSCRLFGHYRSEDSQLPQVCVFRGQEQIFSGHSYYESVPQAVQLRTLVRRYWPFAPTLN